MPRRVERRAGLGVDQLDVLLFQFLHQLVVHQLQPLEDVGRIGLGRVYRQRTLEVVDDRDQRPDQRLIRILHRLLLLSLQALAHVLRFGDCVHQLVTLVLQALVFAGGDGVAVGGIAVPPVREVQLLITLVVKRCLAHVFRLHRSCYTESPLNISFNLSRKPFRCGMALPSSVAANSRKSCFCFSVSFLGTSIKICTSSSPFRVDRRSGSPFPLSLKTSPCWVPDGRSICSAPLRVGTSSLAPRAAWVKETGIWQTRSLLWRLKIGWALTEI